MKKSIRDGKGSTNKVTSTKSEISSSEKKELRKVLNGCNGESTVKSLTARLKKSPVWSKSSAEGKLIRLSSVNGYSGTHTPYAIINLANS